MSSPPSPIRPIVEIAGLRRRLICVLYEILLLLGIWALAVLLPAMVIGIAAQIKLPGIVLWLDIFIVFGLYFVWYWQKHGQTLAMQTWRLKVVDRASGRNPSTRQALLRYVLAWFSLALLGIGFLWALVDAEHRFLHDRLSGCCIVLLPPQNQQ